MKLFFFCLLLLHASIAANAQRGIDFGNISRQFAGHNAVYLKNETQWVFDIVADTLAVNQRITNQLMVLGSRTAPFVNNAVYAGSFNSIRNIQAYTLVPREGRRGFDRVNVTRFKESHDFENSIFFDDSRKIEFSFPSLVQGAVTSLEYDIEYHDPRFLRQWFFQLHLPVLKSRVVVKVHKDVQIGYRVFNGQGTDIQFRQYARGNYHYYEWETNNVDPYRYVGHRHFSVRHHAPHLALFVKETSSKGNNKAYFGDLENIYRFSHSWLSETSFCSTPQLDALVAQLTQGLSTLEKIRAIYYWVQQNIRYIAYVEGSKGYVPADPAEVFAKRFGDCKGMAVLVNKMLELAGVQSSLAWVGTRTIPYTYEECPLPSAANHMITIARYNDSVLVLDATYNFKDLGLNAYSIQGKDALVSVDDENFEIIRIPVGPASENQVIDSVEIWWDGTTLKGQGNRWYYGFNRMELAMTLERVRPPDYARRLATLFSKGNNKFQVTDYNVVSLFEYDKPAQIHYQFRLDDYVMISGDELYVNLNLDRAFQDMKSDLSDRINPVINDFYFTEKHITRFKIPEGYQLSFLPNDETIHYDPFRISFTYSQSEDYVQLEKVMVFEFLELLEDRLPLWNEMVDRLARNYRNSLVFTRSQS